ncbi:putative spermidine/putrescine transport system substrate-binding protein [Sporobacter termitidis DSM 10068]|uniref:Putative spermidine/putrescine transport system substrate-binding protein n=1 Tax=Sporobacter termitidis DSM 10068 TaxID=1123282 RepID=A0A1M5XBF1_9FIRM|nr:ABC transporter substrate-binding protein [Sporobacter termitidis]SHH97069.1 putative spermidine/putrescine transport system substrate-binding protein [Sporobacter termitidis DSM 10068]
MKKTIVRKLLVLTIAALFLVGLAACGAGPSGTASPSASAGAGASPTASAGTAGDLPETDSLVVGVYSGDWETSINKAALDEFAAETGIDVEVVPGADAEWYTKLQAANGTNVPYDLLILQPDTIQKAIEANLLQDLDESNVPNLSLLFDSVNQRFTKDDKLYAAGFSMGQLGICYRTDLVKNPPKSWADLWNSEYAGHVAISPLTYSAGLQFFWSQTEDGKNIDGAFNKLSTLKSNVSAYPDGAGAVQTLIQRGDVWMVPFWDGRAFAWQETDPNIGFVYPEDGPVAAIASWTIPKNAPNLANAYKLLDYLCSAKVQSAYAELSYYGMACKDTAYSDKFLAKAHVGESYYNALQWIDYSVATPNLSDWSTRWQNALG